MFVVIFFSEWSGLAAEGEAKLKTSLNTEKCAEPLPYKTAGYLATVHFSRKVGAADSYDRIDIGCKDDVSHAAVAPAPMRNQQVLLGFNRDPQKVQQYTCNSNENKMADALWGPARVMGLMAMPLTR